MSATAVFAYSCLRKRSTPTEGASDFARAALEQDDLSLNRLLIPLVPAEAGTQFFGRVLGHWIPAFAGMSGDWFNGGVNLNSSGL
jgi:hypothetical protein